MNTIALIRHGPTEWTDAKRLQGRTDIPLSEEGRAFVRTWEVPKVMKTWRWLSSPLKRAVETANILSGKRPLIDDRLIEMNWGEWEGCRLSDLRVELGPVMAENEARGVDFRPPGGESPRDVQARLTAWMIDVSQNSDPVVAVAHHGIIRAFFAMATGWDMVGDPPQKFRWGAAQYFQIDADGNLSVDRLNVDMTGSNP